MSYRLLALDLDGTLLRTDQRVDDADVAAIAELQAAGVTVTIVTGRLRTGALGAARACSIEGPIACMEGSHVVELRSNRNLIHHPMPLAVRSELRATLSSYGLASFVFDADGIHHDHAGAPFARYVATWSPNLRVVEEQQAWDTEALGAVAVGDQAAVAAVHEQLKQRPNELFSVAFPISMVPGKWAMLVRAAGPTKGTALAELCKVAGCSLADAVAVGDWVNDVPMFEVAGRSFAMGNAPEAVRNKATDQLERKAGDGGGIAEAIRRAWG
ncbi:MAG: HAD-IIB family hydrolase [Kofleriaceae bacterium]